MKSKPLSKSAAERFEKFLNKKDSLLEKLDDKWTDLIEDTWLDKPYHYVYRKFKWGWWNPRTCYFMVKYGVENLITYFNVIWNDRDWEYNSWLILNEKKLGRMEDLIRNHGNHLYHVRDADNIRKARLAIKRIIDDDYYENVYANHDRKWGETTMDSEPCSWDEDGKPTLYKMDIGRTKAITEEEKEQCDKEYRRLMRHPDYLKKQDLEYATKIINKYLFHWWD